jgi:hypothetical protein
MQLLDGSAVVKQCSLQRDFPVKIPEVGLRLLGTSRNDLVAATVEAGAGAKGNMDVERKRFACFVAGRRRRTVFRLADALVKLDCGRIGRIPGPLQSYRLIRSASKRTCALMRSFSNAGHLTRNAEKPQVMSGPHRVVRQWVGNLLPGLGATRLRRKRCRRQACEPRLNSVTYWPGCGGKQLSVLKFQPISPID